MVTVPGNLTAGTVYTFQMRQWSPEFNWYYYDCSDVLVVASEADIPADLQAAWQALKAEGNCTTPTFTAVSYPLTIYVLEAILYGSVALVAIVLLAWDLLWFVRWRWQMRCCGCWLPPKPRSDNKKNASVEMSSAVTAKVPAADEEAVETTAFTEPAAVTPATSSSTATSPPGAVAKPQKVGCCGAMLQAARLKWLWLLGQAGAVLVAYACAIGVDAAWKDCTYRPSPGFGP